MIVCISVYERLLDCVYTVPLYTVPACSDECMHIHAILTVVFFFFVIIHVLLR